MEDVGIPVKVKDEGFVTVALELRTNKWEEPSVTVETTLDENLGGKLRTAFHKTGPSSDTFAKWKLRAMRDGTLRKGLGSDGKPITKVVKEVKKIESEKIIVNFPVDVSLSSNNLNHPLLHK